MKTYYLIDDKGYIVSKFEMTSNDSFQGKAYECTSWSSDTKEPIDWLFHSEVYAKFDGCSHWWFKGEDYNSDLDECNNDGVDSYYHICSSFNQFIRTMCFIWKLAGNYHTSDLTKRYLLTDMTIEEYDLDIISYMLKDYKIIEKQGFGQKGFMMNEKEIVKIVTKEQFESMSYKVEE